MNSTNQPPANDPGEPMRAQAGEPMGEQMGEHRISIEATDGHRHHFNSDVLDARYAAERREDGSIEVTIKVSDRAGVLKEFVVRRFAHNEAHDIHES